MEHPADLRIQAFGKNLPDIFVNMALGMASQQLGIKKGGGFLRSDEKKEEIIIEALDRESLLVNWLNEILYRSEVNKKTYIDFKVLEFKESPCRIRAEVSGVRLNVKKEDIKAVTYHGSQIKKDKQGWTAVILQLFCLTFKKHLL